MEIKITVKKRKGYWIAFSDGPLVFYAEGATAKDAVRNAGRCLAAIVHLPEGW